MSIGNNYHGENTIMVNGNSSGGVWAPAVGMGGASSVFNEKDSVKRILAVDDATMGLDKANAELFDIVTSLRVHLDGLVGGPPPQGIAGLASGGNAQSQPPRLTTLRSAVSSTHDAVRLLREQLERVREL